MEDEKYIDYDQEVEIIVTAQENYQTIQIKQKTSLLNAYNIAFNHLVNLRNIIISATSDVKKGAAKKETPQPAATTEVAKAHTIPPGSTTIRQREVLKEYGYTDEQMDSFTVRQASDLIYQKRGH